MYIDIFKKNTDLQNCDVIVHGGVIVNFMYKYYCSTMNSSTRTVVSGARPQELEVTLICRQQNIDVYVKSPVNRMFYIFKIP